MDWTQTFITPQGINVKEVDANLIWKVKDKIKHQATKWLKGLDTPADLLAQTLFMLVPYSDNVIGEGNNIIRGEAAGENIVIAGRKVGGQAHVMFKGGTGIGKTDLSNCTANSIAATFRRIQATPDMLPYDILGGQVLVENLKGERRVQFKPGPIFAHMVLIDEANRMHPKTKASLLEAMEERSVNPKSDYIDDNGQKRPALPLLPLSGNFNDFVSPRFFWVLLTQNIFGEEEGSYPSPMGEVDRITLCIPIERPSFEKEREIRARNVVGQTIERVSDLKQILACAHWIDQNVKTSDRASDYLTQLLRNTDPDPKVTNPSTKLGKFLKAHISVGASPRVNFHLEAAARVYAFFDGSMVVKPEHVKAIARNVIIHRLLLTPGKTFTTTKEAVFEEILGLTEVPKWR